MLPHFGAAGKGEEPNRRIRDQPLADFSTGALHQVDMTGRQARLEKDFE